MMIEFLLSNSVFVGGAGVALTGAALYAARAMPMAAYHGVRSRVVTSLTVRSTDRCFSSVQFWLARNVKNPRRLRIAEDEHDTKFAPGDGWHAFRSNGRWFAVERASVGAQSPGGDRLATPAQPVGGGMPAEAITIYVLGRSAAPLSSILDQAILHTDEDVTQVMSWEGWWRSVGRRPKRAWETVYLPAGVKADLLADAREFLASREVYRARGIPWRRGYLFEGPPGTGKTSAIYALAGELGLPVCVIDPANCQSDVDLRRALSALPARALVLIEDIDAANITADRANAPDQFGRFGVTLSGLLNALDGVMAEEGRILCVTTNYPDKLDAALVRPGRIDRRFRLDGLSRPDAERMAAAFLPGLDVSFLLSGLVYPVSGADLQNRLLTLESTSRKAA